MRWQRPEARRFGLSRPGAQYFGVHREEPIYIPGRAALDEAERQEREVNAMIQQLMRDAKGAPESFYFAGTEAHMQKLRDRVPFDLGGNYFGFMGLGVPLTTTPDTPIVEGATHEARVEFPAGVMPALARALAGPRGGFWLLKQGASLYLEGVVVKEIRALHPAGKK
jgi:hypothetical protein